MSSSPQPATPQTQHGFLARFLRRKAGFSRHHERFDCALLGVMEVTGSGASFEGAVLELSAGGCSFRPASMFLLDRQGETVMVRTDYFTREGKIRAVRASSYGIQFASALGEPCLNRILAENFGMSLDVILDRVRP